MKRQQYLDQNNTQFPLIREMDPSPFWYHSPPVTELEDSYGAKQQQVGENLIRSPSLAIRHSHLDTLDPKYILMISLLSKRILNLGISGHIVSKESTNLNLNKGHFGILTPTKHHSSDVARVNHTRIIAMCISSHMPLFIESKKLNFYPSSIITCSPHARNPPPMCHGRNMVYGLIHRIRGPLSTRY